MPTAPSGVGA